MAKSKTKTRADLLRENMELRAQLAHGYHNAAYYLPKAGQKHMTASGVILTLTALGGREIVPPVMIFDGLSDETISAIHADLIRSYERATEQKPKGAK
jgi:hypothetical protein